MEKKMETTIVYWSYMGCYTDLICVFVFWLCRGLLYCFGLREYGA